eukprot:TRINITY_DN68110_c6_g11_i1.p1 TRINITY_DN68110_c6_g11~~TRINITY_DN68110_c6_g11_i1.p1  ORF type:complete len:111 (+),score=1.10 TRINITY_DN68110_c6_g11_i1:469-801(+)
MVRAVRDVELLADMHAFVANQLGPDPALNFLWLLFVSILGTCLARLFDRSSTQVLLYCYLAPYWVWGGGGFLGWWSFSDQQNWWRHTQFILDRVWLRVVPFLRKKAPKAV